jgi:hypothetical protein
MPNFDSGTYFLTTLIPVSVSPIREEGVDGAPATWTSPVHALRKDITRLPTAWQTTETTPVPQDPEQISPFARHNRAHFARFVVIDDTMFVGRETIDAIIASLAPAIVNALPFLSAERKAKIKDYFDPIVPQPVDHLANPYLFFSADFDAEDGSDEARDSFLRELWTIDESRKQLARIFAHCHDFNRRVTSPESFAAYIAECQVETTMPFHDYYLDNVPLAALPKPPVAMIAATVIGVALVVFLTLQHFLPFDFSGWLEWLGWIGTLAEFAAALFAGSYAGYRYMIYLGDKPLPTPDKATLRDVLKSLYLRREFTKRVIKNQLLAVDPASAQALYDDFGVFLTQVKPDDLDDPNTTQHAGVIGI